MPPLLGRSVINLFTFNQTLTLNQAEEQLAKARCLADRWGELSRKLEVMILINAITAQSPSQVGIEVQELAECGEYQSVEVVHAVDSGCGGVMQLRQVGRPFPSKQRNSGGTCFPTIRLF